MVYHDHTTGRKFVSGTCHILNVLKSVSPAIVSAENVTVTGLGRRLYGAIRQSDVTDRPGASGRTAARQLISINCSRETFYGLGQHDHYQSSGPMSGKSEPAGRNWLYPAPRPAVTGCCAEDELPPVTSQAHRGPAGRWCHGGTPGPRFTKRAYSKMELITQTME